MDSLTILKIKSVDATLPTKRPSSVSKCDLTLTGPSHFCKHYSSNRSGCTIFSRGEKKKVKLYCFSAFSSELNTLDKKNGEARISKLFSAQLGRRVSPA